MKFKMSPYIAIHAKDANEAAAYYEKVFGLKVKDRDKGVNFVDADPFTICVSPGTQQSPATEFIVVLLKISFVQLLLHFF